MSIAARFSPPLTSDVSGMRVGVERGRGCGGPVQVGCDFSVRRRSLLSWVLLQWHPLFSHQYYPFSPGEGVSEVFSDLTFFIFVFSLSRKYGHPHYDLICDKEGERTSPFTDV